MLARSKLSGLLGILGGLFLCLVGTVSEAQNGYRIGSGDTLQIEVLEDPSLNRSVLVLPDGSISFPFVGTLRAAGLTVSDLRQSLAAGLAPNFANQPTVVVSVSSLAEGPEPAPFAPFEVPTIDVYITGEVNNAGKVDVEPGTTILQLVATAGGLTPFAASTRIQLHRTDRATGRTYVYLFSYSGKGKGARIGPGTRLVPGDVVIVPARRLFE